MGTGLAQRGGGLGTDSRARPRRGGRGGSEEIDKGTRLCRSRTARAPSPSPPASGAEVAPRAPDRFSNEHLHPRARPPAAVKEGSPPPGLIAGEELHVEDEGGVGGDDGGVPASAVGVVRGAGQLGTLADGHLRDALVPALDDLAHADLEGELVAAVAGAVELVPGGAGRDGE